MVKPGDIVEYRHDKTAPMYAADVDGYVGIVDRVFTSDDRSHTMVVVRWLYSPRDRADERTCYLENLRKLGEVQHG